MESASGAGVTTENQISERARPAAADLAIVPAPSAIQPVADPLDLHRIKALVLDSLSSPQSRRAYNLALSRFLEWVPRGEPFSKALVQRYGRHLAASGLAPASMNLKLTAVRRLAAEAADNGLLAPELAAGIARVKGEKSSGVRTGTWLTMDQAEQLLGLPDPSTLKGVRDRAILAVLIGAGLRRAEAANLKWVDIQQRNGRWMILDIRGKGNRVRSVPMPDWAKLAIDAWQEFSGAGNSGSVFRSLDNHGRLQSSPLVGQNIHDLVAAYGRAMALPHLAPHDLRRTFAKLAHGGKAELGQIQLSLGHSSIQTTERYLGVRQDLTDAPCDHLGIKGPK